MLGKKLLISGGDKLTLTAANIQEFAFDPNDAYAGIQVSNNGYVQYMQGNAAIYGGNQYAWVDPVAHADDYEIRATLNSGTLTSGTTGSWLALTVNRGWYVAQTVIGTHTAQITLEIRKVGTTTVLVTAVIDLLAQVEV